MTLKIPEKKEDFVGEEPLVQARIREAQRLFVQWEPVLRGNPRIRALLEALADKTRASFDTMVDVGIVEACRHCDEEEGGSCCGAGIENRYQPILLLVNLLLGAQLPGGTGRAGACTFLGEKGCTLKARDVLCVNYLCLEAQKMLAHEDLLRLQHTTGEELNTLFLLLEAVRKGMSR